MKTKIEKNEITCNYCKKVAFDSEFIIYQHGAGVCRQCLKNNVAFNAYYKEEIEKLKKDDLLADDLKNKIATIEKRIYEVEKMMKYLEENPKEKAIYKDVNFEKLYRELNKEILRLGHLESA